MTAVASRRRHLDQSGYLSPMKFTGHLRGYFLAGVVVTAPIAITIWIVWWIVGLFDAWMKPLIPAVYNPETYLPFSVPGLGLIFALVMITLVGALAANLVGRTVLAYWEYLLGRMPVVRSVYGAVKQIFQTAFSQSERSFRQVGLIQFPKPGMHTMVFVARELDSLEIGLPPGRAMVSCFMPATPPMSGFVFFVNKEDVTILDLSIEDGAKLVISAGLVMPDRLSELPGVPMRHDEVAEELVGSVKPADRGRKHFGEKSSRRQEA